MFFLMVVISLGVGCLKQDDPIMDNSNDLQLKSKKIPMHFTGTCTPLSADDARIWYDAADDERVTGLSIWINTGMEPIDEMTNEITGTAEIFVGAEDVGDDYAGKWELTWKVTQTLTSPDGSTFKLVCHAFGTGTEGEVLGLTAKWKYWMDFDGSPESFIYYSKGKITEEL
jgi:hypothetical protein